MAQPELRHAEAHDEREAHGRRGTGVEVGGERQRGAGVEQAPCRRLPALTQKDHRRGEKHRDCRALRQRADAGLRHSGQVIRAHGTELGGELGAAGPVQLVGVQFDPQAMVPGRRGDRARLSDGEHPGLAERITELGETLARHRGNHLVAEEAYELRPAVAVLGWHLMGAEEGGDERRPRLRRQAAHDAQLLTLVVEIEPVPRLDLDGGRAVREQHREPRTRDGDELVLRAGAHVPHRLENAAASGRDRLVVLAEGAALVIVEAWRAKDGVGVAVDEAGVQHPRYFHRLHVAGCPSQLTIGTDRGDTIAVDEHGRVAKDFDLRHLATPARPRRAATGDDRPSPREQCAQSLASRIGRRTPWRRAVSSASGYPASAWRATPIPGSLVSTRSSRRAAAGEPSATVT